MGNDRRIIFPRDSRFALKREQGKPAILTGYAMVWNTLSDDRGGYRVRLKPNSARFAKPTLALFNHDFRNVIGNTENGTLRIMPDTFGVKVEIDLPDTSTGRDVAVLVERGDVTGMSFAMVSAPDGKTVRENGIDIFEVDSFDVDEVTVTPIPSFIQATIAVKPEQKPGDYTNRRNQSLQLEQLKLGIMGAELPQID